MPIGQMATGMLSGEQFDAEEPASVCRLRSERRTAMGTPAANSSIRPTTSRSRGGGRSGRGLRDPEGLQQAVAKISPDDDDKLQRLRTFLAQPDVAQGKVLIFSEAETTVPYL